MRMATLAHLYKYGTSTKFLKFHQYWPLVSRLRGKLFAVNFCHHRPLLTNGSNSSTIYF